MIGTFKKLLSHKGCVLAAAALMAPVAAEAGTLSPKAPVVPPMTTEPEEPFVTGTLSLMANTHFVSYGQDVWGAGNNWDEVLFNPSLELSFNLGGGLSFILGTWWDVNDNAPTTIGTNIQEIDVWAGFSYSVDKFTFTLLYQSWNYAEQIEHIVDLKIAYDHFLSPYLLLHGRVADDIPFDTGLVTQLGISPSKTFGPVTVSLPIAVAFDTDNFHGGDAGFSFASAGVSLSIPIVEHVSASVGVTYYYTNEDVIPVNPDESFFTGSAGITITF